MKQAILAKSTVIWGFVDKTEVGKNRNVDFRIDCLKTSFSSLKLFLGKSNCLELFIIK